MKVFLDIGAHKGETLTVARDPRWAFDRIVCFEPAPECWPHLTAAELCRFGLWKTDATMLLHNAGGVGASIAPDKETGRAVPCEFRDAATWFRDNLTPDDTVFAKVNVEGAEADIIERLAETGALGLVDYLLIHLDSRKSPSLAHRAEQTVALLDRAGVNYLLAEDIEFGGVWRGTRNWLRWCHANPRTRDLRYRLVAGAIERARAAVFPVVNRVRPRPTY